MRRISHKHQLRLTNEISITPLLDVVLVLLFVFMLTAPLWKGDGALELPQAAAATSEQPKVVVPLTIDASQTFHLKEQAIAQKDLPAALQQLVKTTPEAGVLVQIHRELPVQLLVEVMNTLREAGVQKTAIATLQPKP